MEPLSVVYILLLAVFFFCILPSIIQRKDHHVQPIETLFLCCWIAFMVYTWPRNADSIILYLSDDYTQGEFYTRQDANDYCAQKTCRQAIAMVNFMNDDIKRFPENYGVPRYSSVWFGGELIAYSWNELLKTKNIPANEMYWSGAVKNCNEWTGVGVGNVGKSSFNYGLASCNDMHRLLCLCV